MSEPTPDQRNAMADQAEMLAKLKRDDARILDELLDAGDLMEKEEKVTMVSIELDDYRVAARSCGVNQFGFSKTSAVRVNAFRLSQAPMFRNFILAIIMYNVVAMAACTDERMSSDEAFLFFRAPFAQVYDVNDVVITSIFTFEIAVGMIAHGIVIGRHSYLKFNRWNKIDFIVVVTSWLNVLKIGAGSFGFLRALRVLRVIKALKHPRFRGIRKIINSLGDSLELLKNVLLLSFFGFYLFAVFGLNMFMGRLGPSCEGYPASLNLTGHMSCEDYFHISSHSGGVENGTSCQAGCVFTAGAIHDLCDVRGQCYANFDSIVWAGLTVFRSVTMEGWSDICYVLMSVVDPNWQWAVVVYFFCLLMLMTNLVVNLFVAVICTQFAGTKISDRGHEDLQRLRILRGLWLQHDPTGDGVLRTATLRRILSKILNTDEKVDVAINLMTASRQQKAGEAINPTAAAEENSTVPGTWRFDTLLEWARGELTQSSDVEPEPKLENEKCFARFINRLETLTGIDIDGDGDIGVMGTTSMPELGGLDGGGDPAKGFQGAAGSREQQLYEERSEMLQGGNIITAIQRRNLDVVKTRAFSNFILVCVVFNTAFLALEYHGQSIGWGLMLLTIERVFLVIFTIEMVMKWLGWGVKNYFGFNANKFDFVLVTVSMVEQGVLLAGGGVSLGSLSVLRSFRLLRVFRAMRRLEGLRRIIAIMSESSEGVWSNFLLVMFVLVIFSLLGMQLFSNEAGRGFSMRFGHNFDTFWSSMLLWFQVLTGENWVELLEMGMAHSTAAPVALFIIYYITVVYVLLNIFIALIMDQFEIPDDEKRTRQAAEFRHEFMTMCIREIAGEQDGRKTKLKKKKVRSR